MCVRARVSVRVCVRVCLSADPSKLRPGVGAARRRLHRHPHTHLYIYIYIYIYYTIIHIYTRLIYRIAVPHPLVYPPPLASSPRYAQPLPCPGSRYMEDGLQTDRQTDTHTHTHTHTIIKEENGTKTGADGQ